MNSEQQKLIIRAENSLKAAQTLLESGFYEDSVSRAYYAMFYIAVALLQTKNLTVHTHASVLSSLGQYFVKTGFLEREYHRYLIDAEDLRRKADYDVNIVIPQASVVKQIQNAEAFIAMGKKLLTPEETGE